MSLVTLQNVSKTYALRAGRTPLIVQALKSVSFEVAESEVAILIGPSGCGKTTALRILMGLETATGGVAAIGGKIVKGCGYDRGLVFQHAELLPWLSALQNVMFGLELKGMRGAELKDTAMHYLELVHLAEAAHRRPYQLSGGMKQRVGIARALAIDPKVLLMDEPFGALDAQTRESLQTELLEIQLRTRKTIVFVTHDLDEAVLLADRIILMRAGEVRENMPIRLPGERRNIEDVRGSREFAETRHHVWKALRADGAARH